MSSRINSALAPLVGLLLVTGCGPSRPAATDPDRGKAVLCAALDTWKQGGNPESLKDRSPPIHVNDPDWSRGAQLDRYEVMESEGKVNGYDYSCPVTLWLRVGSGSPTPRKVSYTVGAGQSLVVVRGMGG